MNEEKIEIERERYPFIILEKAIFDDQRSILLNGNQIKIGKHEILTYVAVCYFADSKNGKAFPSIRKIGDVIRLGKSTIHEALKTLVAFGYLEVKNRRKRSEKTGEIYQSSNLYKILSSYKVIHNQSPPHGGGVVRHTDTMNKIQLTRIRGTRGNPLWITS